jgi:ATPase family associated with various cellular activities (AAA)
MRTPEWTKASQDYLSQEIIRLQVYIEQRHRRERATFDFPRLDQRPQPFLALDQLTYTFDLTPYEWALLMLCIGWELTNAVPQQCIQYLDKPLSSPTIDLALTLFGPETDPFDPRSPLFQWHLLEGKPGFLINQPLTVERWTLHYLLGYDPPAPQFNPSTLPKAVPYSDDILSPSQENLLVGILNLWDEASTIPITQLIGEDEHAPQLIAATAFDKHGYHPYELSATDFTFEPNLIEDWIIYWQRLASLENYALILHCGDPATLNPVAKRLIAQLLKDSITPLFLTTTERLPKTTNLLTLELSPLNATDQKQLWTHYLQDAPEPLDTQIGALVVQFNLTAHQIQSAASQAIAQTRAEDPSVTPQTLTENLWKVCQTQSRSSLEGLVERIEPKTTWNELILPPEPSQILHQIIATIRQRAKVYEDWKMGGETRRGMGITSLFYGPSGTGKTTAAEIIAHDLKLDLYRVDLSQVSSKYIGETEKNLKKVFAAAESSGAVLLFDEADSIIGKRSEVKDARDRYANQEVGYLLQAMENYSGLAILTTNLPNSLDTAFMRRIRFSIRFEYPTPEERAQIWQRNFPPTAPTLNLSYQRLAQLNVSGASIRNIAMGGAFVAAQDDAPIQMKHILQAARAELLKLGRSITDQEIRGWV